MITKTYECRTCTKRIDVDHPNANDTTVPVCAGHGPMERVYVPVRISMANKDWTAGKSDDYIAGAIAGEYDP